MQQWKDKSRDLQIRIEDLEQTLQENQEINTTAQEALKELDDKDAQNTRFRQEIQDLQSEITQLK